MTAMYDIRSVSFRSRNVLLALFVVVLSAGLPLAVWLDLRNLTEAALRRQAADINSIISSIRGYYASNIVGRILSSPGPTKVMPNYKDIPGAIPIPATLSIELGRVVGEQQSNITYRFVSDFPFRNRAPHELDSFERKALSALRQMPKQQKEQPRQQAERQKRDQDVSVLPQDQACEQEAEQLRRLRDSQNGDEVIRLERALSCEKLRPQVLRLRQSLIGEEEIASRAAPAPRGQPAPAVSTSREPADAAPASAAREQSVAVAKFEDQGRLEATNEHRLRDFAEVSSSLVSERIRHIVPIVMGQTCVSCHNSDPDSPKHDWKVGDVRGIQELSVSQPIAANVLSFRYLLLYFGISGASGLAFIVMQSRQAALIRNMNRELARQHHIDESRLDWLQQLARFLRHEVRQPVAQINSSIEVIQLTSDRDVHLKPYLDAAALAAIRHQHVNF
jgi:hypothetical protein